MKKTNNKGFSLVELIIVIAIMAILVGAIAPALIRYIDKSRRSNDVSACKTIKTAVETALANEAVYEAITSATGDTLITITPNEAAPSAPSGTNIVNFDGEENAYTGADKAYAKYEIFKNIGDKAPKLSFKKALRGNMVPKQYIVIISNTGMIYVGIAPEGDTFATPSYDESTKKYSADGYYLILPETCDEYK